MSKHTIEAGSPSPAELLAGHATAILEQYKARYGANEHADTHDIDVLGELVDIWQGTPDRFYVAGSPRLRRAKATADNRHGTIVVAQVELREKNAYWYDPSLVLRARTPRQLDILEEFVEDEVEQPKPSERMLGHEFRNVRRDSQEGQTGSSARPSVDVALSEWRTKFYNGEIATSYLADNARARIVYDPLTMTTVARGHSGTHNAEFPHNLQSSISEGTSPTVLFATLRNFVLLEVKKAKQDHNFSLS